jgi:hypothetical protein
MSWDVEALPEDLPLEDYDYKRANEKYEQDLWLVRLLHVVWGGSCHSYCMGGCYGTEV